MTTISTSPTAEGISQLVLLDAEAKTVHYGDLRFNIGVGPQARSALATWLYTNVHAGNPNAFSTDAVLPDATFERSIRGSINDRTIAVPVRPLGGNPHVVELHRVRLTIKDTELITDPGQGPSALIPSQRPNLTPGFFMYVNDPQGWTADTAVIRFYVGHNDPVEALRIWSTAVTRLTDAGIEFRSKILSRRGAYPRNDALVFYATADAESLLAELRSVMKELDAQGLGDGSPLCAQVGFGIHQAEDPRDLRPGRSQPSYGEHRCGMIADALMSAVSGDESYLEALVRLCLESNIDSDNLARNGTTYTSQKKIA
jgi:hypothetical protein